jgi:WD40 repeat protein
MVTVSYVFLSYVHEDSEKVDRLAAELRARGAQVWLDKEDIAPGTRWKDAIRQAIERGTFFVACFSKNYAARESNYMNAELSIAIDELSKRRHDRAWFLPVLLDSVDVPDRSIGGMESLGDIQFVAMYEDWDKAVQRLVAAIEPAIAAHEAEGRLRDTGQPVHVEATPTPTKPTVFEADAIFARPVAWNPADTVQIGERAQDERVLAVAFHPDGSLLATAGANKAAQLWSVPRLDKVSDPLRHEGLVSTVAFSPDGRVLASAGEDLTVRIWDVDSGAERHRLVHDDEIKPPYGFNPFLAFNDSGSLLATASLLGKLRVWDLSTGLPLPHIPGIEHVYGIAFRPFDRLLATAGLDGKARIWDVDSGDVLKVKEHPSGIFEKELEQVEFSPDGRLMATVAQGGSARVWEIESGAEVSELRRDGVASVVFSQVGRRMVAAGTDGAVRVWEIDSGDELFNVNNTEKVRKFACNPDATLFALLDEYRIVRVCDVSGSNKVLDQPGVLDVKFSPDGRRLATAGFDKSVLLWASKAH